MNRKSLILACAILLTILIIPVACQQPRYGGTLVVRINGNPTGFNFAVNPVVSPYMDIDWQMFDALVRFDQNYNIIPGLAESWKISSDGLTYTFNLRKNAKWHDGVEFTSKDVKFTFETILKEKLTRWTNLEMVSSIETPDKYTVVIKLKSLFAPFLYAVSDEWIGLLISMPAHLYNGTNVKENPYNMKPIGNGPFKFVEYVKGSHITIERFADYWAPVYLDKQIWRIIPDNMAAVTAMEAGEVQYTEANNIPEQIETLKKAGFKVESEPVTFMSYIWVNINRPNLNNKKVRQALWLVINREVLARDIYYGHAVPGTSVLARGVKPFYNAAVEKMYPTTAGDIDKANSLLDEAGLKKGADGMRFSIEAMFTAGATTTENQLIAMQSMWKKIGVDLKLKPTEATTLQSLIGWMKVGVERKFDIVTWGTSTGPDPDLTVYDRYHSNSARNANDYANPEVDKLLEDQRKVTDPAERAKLWYKIQEIMMDELPLFPVLFTNEIYVWNPDYANPKMSYYRMQQNLRDAWWTKGTVPTTTVTTSQVRTTVTTVPTSPDLLTPLAVVAVIVVAVVVVWRIRAKPSKKADTSTK